MTKIEDTWTYKKLTDLADYINGYPFKPDDWGKEGLPIIRIEQLKNPDSVTDYFSGLVPEKNVIDNGDLIFSWSASLFLRIWNHGRAALNQHLFKVIEKPDVDRLFLKQFIEYHLPEITKVSHGSTMQHITRKELARFGAMFPVRTLEQTKIAEFLSTVDRAIEQTEALIAKQQRIKTGLMQDLLTRGIDEHGNIRSEETHQFKDSPLGRIPVEWEVVPLSQLADAIDPQPDHRTPPEVSEGIPYVGVSDFCEDGSIDFEGARKVSAMALRKQQDSFGIALGDFVFGKIGTIGVPERLPTFADYALSANVILLKPRETPSFIYWWMASPIVERLVELEIHSTSQAAFGIQKMRVLKITKPTRQERQRIGDIFDALELHERAVVQELEKLRALKMALMQDLLTGKKRVAPLLKECEVVS